MLTIPAMPGLVAVAKNAASAVGTLTFRCLSYTHSKESICRSSSREGWEPANNIVIKLTTLNTSPMSKSHDLALVNAAGLHLSDTVKDVTCDIIRCCCIEVFDAVQVFVSGLAGGARPHHGLTGLGSGQMR